MEEKVNGQEERQLVKFDDMSLEETQLAEQLYNSAGLDPVVEAGLKDYDERIQLENKLISKVFGPRGSDIKGYGDAVARRVAFAVYSLLNKQYGGKVGDLRSYIMTLQDERDRANSRYDELMGRVVGILGEEYKELKADSREFMEKFTTVLGEDLKESKIDQKALAETLADIDGLRNQIANLGEQKEQQRESYESRIAEMEKEHSAAIGKLNSQIAELSSKIESLESEKTELTGEISQLRADYDNLKEAAAKLTESIPFQEVENKLAEELYNFLLKDSKVPDMVIDGVGKFIDLRKYLRVAAKRGAEDAIKQAGEVLRKVWSK